MCFYSDVTTECASESFPRARKAHKCHECGGTIERGEVYYKCTGVCDGSGFTHKNCRRCQYDRERIVDHELAEGCRWDEAHPSFGELRDALSESDLKPTPVDAVPAGFDIRCNDRQMLSWRCIKCDRWGAIRAPIPIARCDVQGIIAGDHGRRGGCPHEPALTGRPIYAPAPATANRGQG